MKWLILFGLFAALALFVSQLARAGELPKVGEAAPDFELSDQNGVKHNLKEFAGKWLVLYFYPKDDTPGCTAEACNLNDNYAFWISKGYEVVGISPDSEASHAKFVKKVADSTSGSVSVGLGLGSRIV